MTAAKTDTMAVVNDGRDRFDARDQPDCVIGLTHEIDLTHEIGLTCGSVTTGQETLPSSAPAHDGGAPAIGSELRRAPRPQPQWPSPAAASTSTPATAMSGAQERAAPQSPPPPPPPRPPRATRRMIRRRRRRRRRMPPIWRSPPPPPPPPPDAADLEELPLLRRRTMLTWRVTTGLLLLRHPRG